MSDDKPEFEKNPNAFMDALKKMIDQGASIHEVKSETSPQESDSSERKTREQRLHFDLKPRDVKKYLDRFVIKQDEAKKVLATAVCDHYNQVRLELSGKAAPHYAKQNILLIGPTGVGKTHLVRHLAELVGVPFAKADATQFSETGYAGGDVEDLVRDLVQKADGDIELARFGIIYLDEIDKIASAQGLTGRDVSGSGVQRGLLKLMEDAEVPLRNPQDIQSQLQSMAEFQKKGRMSRPTLSTRHILFIVSGAFDGLAPLVERRLRESAIGFSSSHSAATAEKGALLGRAATEDFIRFGFESEFVGRLPVRAVCEPLSQEDLFNILTHAEDSILKQHVAAFGAYGIQMQAHESALWEIAKLAAHEKTGARGLFTICEKIFRHLKYELPSSRVQTFHLTPAFVHKTAESLDSLLSDERLERRRTIENEIHQFETAFAELHGIRIVFDEPALKAVSSRILAEGLEAQTFLKTLLINYGYGLALIQKRKPCEAFTLPVRVCDNPNALLDGWIKEAYDP